MFPEYVIVRERVPEEVGPFEATPHRLALVLVAHERGDARDVRVHGVTDRHALLCECGVVVVHPVRRLFGIDERERERADPVLCREVDGLPTAARDPDRRMRFLRRLRYDVARRHRDVLTVVARERRLGEAPQRNA